MKRHARILVLMFGFILLVACTGSQERRDSFYAKAKQSLAAGEIKDAQIALKNALKIDPQFAQGYALLGTLQIQDRNYANAYASYARAVELDPNELEAQLGLCKLFYLQRSFDKVEEKADFILAKQAENVDAGVLKAIALMKKGNTDEALSRLAALQQKNPENIDVILARSETYAARKEFAEAERTIAEGIAKNPKNILLHVHIANLFMQQKRLDDAEKHYKEIAILEPMNPGANMLLVNFYIQAGQSAKAVSALEGLVQRFPNEESYRLAQAQAVSQSGASASAVEAVLARANKDLPNSNQIRLALAEHYARTMQASKAESLLLEFINKDPDLPQAVRARRILASAYLASQQTDKAQTELEAVLKRNPRDTEGHFLMGNLDLQKGRVREAILELRQVVDDDPKSTRAYEMLVRSHLLNNEALQAESLLRKSLNENPDNLQTRMLLVETYVSSGKVDNALKELSGMAEKDRGNPAIFITMGDIYAQKQRLSEAKTAYKKAIEVAPKEPLGYTRLGRVLWAQRDAQGALAAFDQALLITADAREAAEAKAALLMLEKRQDEALKFAKQRVSAQPTDAFNAMLLGRVMLETNDLAGAEQQFSQAIQIAPESPLPYQYLGQVNIRQGKIAEGITKYRDAYKANPNNPTVGLAFAMILHAHSKFDEAKTVYEELLAKSPDNLQVVNNLAYLYAQDLPTAENLKKALALVERLKKFDSGASLDTVGWVLFKAGKTEEALTTTLRAWDKAKGFPTVAYHLGMIYQAKGDTPKALGWLEKALVGNSQFPERDAAQAELGRLRGKK